jgi:hypothetical protein
MYVWIENIACVHVSLTKCERPTNPAFFSILGIAPLALVLCRLARLTGVEGQYAAVAGTWYGRMVPGMERLSVDPFRPFLSEICCPEIPLG